MSRARSNQPAGLSTRCRGIPPPPIGCDGRRRTLRAAHGTSLSRRVRVLSPRGACVLALDGRVTITTAVRHRRAALTGARNCSVIMVRAGSLVEGDGDHSHRRAHRVRPRSSRARARLVAADVGDATARKSARRARLRLPVDAHAGHVYRWRVVMGERFALNLTAGACEKTSRARSAASLRAHPNNRSVVPRTRSRTFNGTARPRARVR